MQSWHFNGSCELKKTGDVVRGFEALKFMIAETEGKAKNKTATLDDLTPLAVFGWLVPEDIKDRTSKLIKEVREGVAEELRSQASKAKISKARAQRPAGADDATAAALHLFS